MFETPSMNVYGKRQYIYYNIWDWLLELARNSRETTDVPRPLGLSISNN